MISSHCIIIIDLVFTISCFPLPPKSELLIFSILAVQIRIKMMSMSSLLSYHVDKLVQNIGIYVFVVSH